MVWSGFDGLLCGGRSTRCTQMLVVSVDPSIRSPQLPCACKNGQHAGFAPPFITCLNFSCCEDAHSLTSLVSILSSRRFAMASSHATWQSASPSPIAGSSSPSSSSFTADSSLSATVSWSTSCLASELWTLPSPCWVADHYGGTASSSLAQLDMLQQLLVE